MANHEVDSLIIQNGSETYEYSPDLSSKVSVDQGTENAGKALGIGNDGMVIPVPFSGNDFTGATESAAGVHGYVPAPTAGQQSRVLMGGGTWELPPGAKIITVSGTITNVSGSYSNTFLDDRVFADMKPIRLKLDDPQVFYGNVTVTPSSGYITISCSKVIGTSTFEVDLIKAEPGSALITSDEYNLLNNKINLILKALGLVYYNNGLYVDPDQESGGEGE